MGMSLTFDEARKRFVKRIDNMHKRIDEKIAAGLPLTTTEKNRLEFEKAAAERRQVATTK